MYTCKIILYTQKVSKYEETHKNRNELKLKSHVNKNRCQMFTMNLAVINFSHIFLLIYLRPPEERAKSNLKLPNSTSVSCLTSNACIHFCSFQVNAAKPAKTEMNNTISAPPSRTLAANWPKLIAILLGFNLPNWCT